VKEIRVKYYPKISRLIFRLAELPGLPEENRNVRNYFDVRVPYMRFNQPWELQNGLARLLNLSFNSLPLNPTNSYFPLIYTNATVREIFWDVDKRLANPGDELRPNPATNQIEVKRPILREFLDKLRALL
jgi:hypothetical protein